MVGSAKKRRRQKQLYYAEHREELLAKRRAEYRASHPKGPRRKPAAAVSGEHSIRKRASKLSHDSPNYYARHREEILLKRKQKYHDNREEILMKRKQIYHDNREEILSKRKQWYHGIRKAKGYTSREYSRTRKHTLNPESTKRKTKPRYFVKYSEGLVLKLQKLEVSKDSDEFDRKRQNLEEVVSKIARDVDTRQPQTTLDSQRLWKRSGICRNSGSLLRGGNSVCQDGDTILTIFTCRTEQEDPITSVDFTDYKHDIAIVGVDNQPAYGSFLTKSQQKLDKMLTRLETDTDVSFS